MLHFSNDLALVVVAIVLATLGGEFFLKGVLRAADGLRVPKLLVATTLAACATSAPELTVSTVAALAGQPEIGLGDALGSNVVNIGLIFGLALLFGPIKVARGELGRDFPLALFAPLLTLGLAADGVLSRGEGGLLLVIFAAWVTASIRAGLHHREVIGNSTAPSRLGWTLVLTMGGLIALVTAGRLFVMGATGIAMNLGVDTYVIGATIVAVGTSLPELVTVVLARRRGHDEVGVGTLIGSNLFNGLAIVGTAASIHPVHVSLAEISVALVMGMTALSLLMPNHAGTIGRLRGLVLLVAYSVFVMVTLAVGGYTGP
ncbi:sodium:calcium antiporter [Denitratisoma oestradiolicum]|uniref:Sodium/calcium exchanger membrane region domain-containing protein n=1 Tax=Denitratisoma oestradiolicum TaxID=311182 RepID=A0A6S6XTC7_9PROT|nr:sodium:calcium antiporter [Denitratisoma oestradiolicum]TWO79385.1 hypothetical protein CBW56_15290 [Denitratisoma oestradiolicum]CAB1368000.1 conserved membrane protein of unknown function [Denitratisoma oestradiolicum]